MLFLSVIMFNLSIWHISVLYDISRLHYTFIVHSKQWRYCASSDDAQSDNAMCFCFFFLRQNAAKSTGETFFFSSWAHCCLSWNIVSNLGSRSTVKSFRNCDYTVIITYFPRLCICTAQVMLRFTIYYLGFV